MGIAALALTPSASGTPVRARALGVAVRFALGHALLLGAGAGVLILLGWSLPMTVEHGGEVLGGTLLIALGALGAWGALSGRVYGHSHVHAGDPAAHWHLHIGTRAHHPPSSAHSHVPTILGAAFAISSLRALTMLTPFGDRIGDASLPMLLTLVGVFAVGILISMSLFGIAFARIMSARAIVRMGKTSALLMATASIALGGYWIAAAL
jgi:hypothetical protein